MIKRARKIISYIYPIVLEHEDGEIVPCVEVRVNNGKLTLDGISVNYSFGSLHRIFDKTFEYFNLRDKEIKSALILGFGAGSVAQIITKKYNPDCEIIGVERDGVILKHAEGYFNLDKYKNLTIIKEDAVEYVKTTDQKFDLIVIDLFVENRVPVAAKQKEFLKNVKRLLNEDSIVFFNKITHTEETKTELKKLATNMEKVFGRIFKYKLMEYGIENTMLIHNASLNPAIEAKSQTLKAVS